MLQGQEDEGSAGVGTPDYMAPEARVALGMLCTAPLFVLASSVGRPSCARVSLDGGSAAFQAFQGGAAAKRPSVDWWAVRSVQQCHACRVLA